MRDITDNDLYFSAKEALFEERSRDKDGFITWSARELATILGYENAIDFKPAIQRAQEVCIALDIDVLDHFQKEITLQDGKEGKDTRLSRFACYLVVMNGDVKKPQIAKAQAYFATFAEACRQYVSEVKDVERVLIRDDISDHEIALSSAAKRAGVENFRMFQNAGYLGLYNMNAQQLRKIKGAPKGRTPLDFMGKEELAANLFRITQTEAKIRNEQITGQQELEKAAYNVGKTVRSTMHDISGNIPEDIAPAEDIRKVKSSLKKTSKGLSSIDRKKKENV